MRKLGPLGACVNQATDRITEDCAPIAWQNGLSPRSDNQGSVDLVESGIPADAGLASREDTARCSSFFCPGLFGDHAWPRDLGPRGCLTEGY